MVKSKVMKALLASFLLILLLALGENIYFKRRVPLGIYIGENYAGGKTYQELDLTLHIINEELEKEKIYFCIPGEERPLVFTLGELAIQLDEEKILAGIYRLNTPFCYRQKIITYRKHLQVPLSFIMDKNKFFAVWEPLGNLRNSPPKNAQIWVTADKVNLKPHKTGKRLKLEQLPEKIGTALEAGPAFPLTIAIEQEDLFPELTISEIFNRGIIDEISAAHTYFDPAAANRAFNINRAAQKIDNTLLAPGQVFSFNQIVGKAGLEEGFKEAPVIVNNRIEMGPGGGICQVSTTLYNAVVKAGLDIVERHNHGLAVGYVAPGYDAAVAYNYLDFKFKNNMPFYILLHLLIQNNELKAVIFGNPSKAKSVKIATKNLQRIEPPVYFREIADQPISYNELIQAGKPGYTAETVRIFYENEKEIFRESLGKNYYAPTPEIFAIGALPDDT